MSRRDALPQRSARRSYVDPEEVYEDQPTRAARPSVVMPDDLRDLSDLEATRAPRESYVALSELPQLPPQASRPSYVAAMELEGEIVEDEVTSFVDRSSRVADSERHEHQPESVTTCAVRPSYVAREELDGSDEHLSYATSEIEEVHPEQHRESAPMDYEALSRFLFDDVPPARSALSAGQPADDVDRYADNGTLLIAPESRAPQSYESHPRQPARCIRQELDASNETPAQPLQPMRALPTRRSRFSIHDEEPQAVRRPMPSVHPDAIAMPMTAQSFGPPSPVRRPMPSHHAYEAVMQQFQAPMQQFQAPMPMSSRRSMPSVHPHDSSASPWVVPAVPSTRRGVTTVKSSPYRLTPSTLAAAFVALLAVTVMVGAVLFVRSEEPVRAQAASTSFVPAAETAVPNLPSAPVPSAPAMIVISSDDIAIPEPAMPAAARTAPAVAAPVPSSPVLVAPAATIAPKPIAAAAEAAPKPIATPPVTKPVVNAAAPARAAAPAKKGGEKSVEDILKELGEEQLLR